MKNIKIVLSALIISLFSSCQDAIDIVQPGEVPPSEVFKTVEDLDRGVLGAYQQMSTMGEIAFNSIFTDEVRLGFANGGQGLNDGTYGFVLNTNSGDATSIWGSNYRLINYANRIIEGAANVTGDENLKNNAIAQARIMRAFGHFRLLSYFSTNLADDNALGVILMDHVPALNEHLPRSKNSDVFALIDADLEYGIENLSSNEGNKDKTSLSEDFIHALKARMALYREQYDIASEEATLLLSKYQLSPARDYSYLWLDTKRETDPADPTDVFIDENIFKLDHIKGEARIGSIWASVSSKITGSPFFSVSTDLFLNMQNGSDVRYLSFIGGDSDLDYVNNPGKIVVAKYPGDDINGAMLNDEKIFRASEMVFILAEVAAAANDMAEVANQLQSLIDLRIIGSTKPQIAVPANQKAAFAEILKQRRIEFAFEGHRWLDLKRIGPKAGVNILRNPLDCAVNGACFLSSSDYRFTLPIPNAEISANPAIGKSNQNPGYN